MNLSEKLHETFQCILGGKLCHEMDDTLLQKLLSSLDTECGNPEQKKEISSFLEDREVLECILGCLGRAGGPPASLAFACRALALLLKRGALDVSREGHLLSPLEQQACSCQQASTPSSLVLVSLLTCLSTLAQQEGGRRWIHETSYVSCLPYTGDRCSCTG